MNAMTSHIPFAALSAKTKMVVLSLIQNAQSPIAIPAKNQISLMLRPDKKWSDWVLQISMSVPPTILNHSVSNISPNARVENRALPPGQPQCSATHASNVI
ncbi:MAG: hypothetical protein Hyperionvirus4_131 [Hyperionvirus sp.]|uniref:Uncharacterized protein n=1 Tax=Hyperionvirus sp. TaxID=2487770 RepID=A0A3G5A7D6_9VIRU|nr:MAG: hypothetical protein Hyperionvirus4_131 [Hyperionvirus sp.]